jgi:hypothetical protein
MPLCYQIENNYFFVSLFMLEIKTLTLIQGNQPIQRNLEMRYELQTEKY